MQAENLSFSALKSAFEASSLPFAILNSGLQLIYANDALIGKVPEIQDPATFSKLFKKLDKAAVLAYLKAERHYEFTCDLPDQNGANISLNAVLSNEGEFLGAAMLFPAVESAGIFPTANGSDYPAAVNREFRERLTMMFTSIYAISHSSNFEPTPNVCEFINHINQNCYQLLRVSDNLEKILRLSSQDERATFRLVNFTDYVNTLVSTIIRMDNKNQIPIKFNCKCGALAASIDLSKMEFAITNIILNSLKYTREGNQIEITLDKVGSSAVLSISDKGAGIPKDVLKKVGTPYFSYSHGERFDAGFGIGLYIAKKYIAAHSGIFSIQSEENEGTCVSISIPLYSEKGGAVGEIEFESPEAFEPWQKFSQTSIQLSEVCYYPAL